MQRNSNYSGFYNASGPVYGPFLLGSTPEDRPTAGPVPSPTPTAASKTSGLGSFFTDLAKTVSGGIINKITTPKTGTAADVAAVCGRRPLLNLGGKRDAYDACAQNLVNQQGAAAQAAALAAAQASQKIGMSTGVIVAMSLGAAAVLTGIVIVAVKMSKKNKASA